MITSSANPKIKKVIGLRDRRDRKNAGLTIIEGVREVRQAVDGGVLLKEIYVCDELLKKHGGTECKALPEKAAKSDPRAELFQVDKKVFMKMAYGQRAEGILAVGAPAALSLEQLPTGKDLLYVVIEKVEKPGNLGAILRACDGAGVDAVIICDGSTDIYNPNAIRSSLGTVFTNRVAVAENRQVADHLRSGGIAAFAATPAAKEIYTNASFKRSMALVVGSEQDGLSDFWLERAEYQIKIPMMGRADSLNVASSTAVLLYEIIRQRSS